MKSADPAPVPLVELYRGGRWECPHFGSVAVCDTTGTLLESRGQPQAPIYLRSSAKPFQAMTLLQLGAADAYGWTEEELALICASHGAQAMHLQVVQGILAKAGLSPEQLGCGAHAPMHHPSAIELYRQGRTPDAMHNNCSGKHAGMLAACKRLGWPLDSYVQADHPLQQANLQTLAAFAGVDSTTIATGVDGCGVPSFYLPLAAAATAFARLSRPESAPAAYARHADTIVRAMCGHPRLIAYDGDFGAALLEQLGEQLVAKGGAEGVFCIGLRGRGIGIAIKISDGASRPVPALTLSLLHRYLPADRLETLRARLLRPLTNCRGEIVGELHVVVDPQRRQ